MKKLFGSLNGWQRIGVVLSIIWFFGAGITQRVSDVNKAEFHADLSSRICYDSYKNSLPGADLEECNRKYKESYDIWIDGSLGSVIFMAIVPIPLFWGIIILLIKVYRWIWRGFAK